MKKIYKIVFLLIPYGLSLITYSFSQIAPAIEWQNTIGGSSTELLYDIKQSSDGEYFLGGYSHSNISGDKTEDSWNNTFDYWIVKADSLGDIQWQNTIGGTASDMLLSVQQTADGGYILGGFSNSDISGDKTENSMAVDYWIIKTDPIGNIQWQNTIRAGNQDHLYYIQQTTDGGYILGGNTASDSSGDKTENCNGGIDGWIIKTDSSGTIQWQNTIGGDNNDLITSLQQTVDGGYIIGAASNSNISGDKTENSNGDYDCWIIKTDSLGTIQWQNTIGGNGGDGVISILQTTDGGYIFGGYSSSNIS
ncbi:MAG TPA: T9SS C-terminal target domain-containing protein, partial [Bacteroidia bacterium]|nr:T9SS C-terminal target domain-containing protein [Bacteroidia bacterium]